MSRQEFKRKIYRDLKAKAPPAEPSVGLLFFVCALILGALAFVAWLISLFFGGR